MPLYVYRCVKCGEEQEVLTKADDQRKKVLDCATCDAVTSHERQPTKTSFRVR